MAAAPTYASTPVAWLGLVPSANDTSWTAPTHVTTLGTAGSSGTKITEIDVIPAGTVVAGLVNIFIYDGTNYHLHESIPVAAYTSSTTAAPPKSPYYYDNLLLEPGWTLVCTTTVAGNESLVEVNAFGASL